MKTIAAGSVAELFRGRYRREPAVFRAPGRVNLIGDHTDYNQGFVLPAAVDVSAWAAVAPREDRRVRVFSRETREEAEFLLDELRPGARGHWTDYVRGMAGALEAGGARLPGADLVVASDVPLGAGLSSSAALEVSVALALLDSAGASMDRQTIALAAQKAEHEYVGARCGIMDQLVSCFGKAGHAVLLDCRDLSRRWLPIPAGVALVVCDSGVRHSIAGGEYNERRAACEEAARRLGLSSLRDATLQDVSALPDPLRRRARHVVSENARVLAAAAALERGDARAFGRWMSGSHESLRNDFEVSCPELDELVSLADGAPGVYGARMTGGGFGGCTVNLVAEDRVDEFRARVAAGYPSGKTYSFVAADGAGPA